MSNEATALMFLDAANALSDEGIGFSRFDPGTGPLWVGTVHGSDAFCNLEICAEPDGHYAVVLNTWFTHTGGSEEDARRILYWTFGPIMGEEVEVGPLTYDPDDELWKCAMLRVCEDLRQMQRWVEHTLNTAWQAGLQFSQDLHALPATVC